VAAAAGLVLDLVLKQNSVIMSADVLVGFHACSDLSSLCEATDLATVVQSLCKTAARELDPSQLLPGPAGDAAGSGVLLERVLELLLSLARAGGSDLLTPLRYCGMLLADAAATGINGFTTGGTKLHETPVDTQCLMVGYSVQSPEMCTPPPCLLQLSGTQAWLAPCAAYGKATPSWGEGCRQSCVQLSPCLAVSYIKPA